MKTQSAHAHEDRLLDFAYDELPLSEAQAVEQHVQGCSRCAETLQGIRGVRRSMARLPREEAPVEGLDSLLAYAEQSARRAAAGAEPAPRWWRRLMAPALSMAAVSVLGVVVLQVNEESVPTAVTQIAFKSQEGSARLVESPAPAPPAPAASAPAADSFAEADSSGMAVEDEERAPPSKSKYKSAPAMRTGVARGEARRERSKKMALREEPSAVGGAPSSPPAPVQTQAEVASAPPPPPAAAAPEPKWAASGGKAAASKEEMNALDDLAEGHAQRGSVSRPSPSPGELMRQADRALLAGERSQEVTFLRAALNAGPQGAQALTVFSRLCAAESALGRRRNALESCKRVVAMAPDSSEARSAHRLLERMLQAPEASPEP